VSGHAGTWASVLEGLKHGPYANVGRHEALAVKGAIMDLQLSGKLALVAFIASPLSSATNGTALRADGGVTRSII
jgi:hypothetical protein